MQVIAIDLELFQLALQFAQVDPQVKQGADEHVPGNAAEEVEVKCFHDWATSMLIWLAA